MTERVYYRVKPPGEPDVYHKSESCAGNFTSVVDRDEADDVDAKPCGVCVPDA